MSPIEFIVDTANTVIITGESYFLDKLDSVSQLKWQQAIYHAHPVNALFGIRPSWSVIKSEDELPWSTYSHEIDVYYNYCCPGNTTATGCASITPALQDQNRTQEH